MTAMGMVMAKGMANGEGNTAMAMRVAMGECNSNGNEDDDGQV